MPPRSVYATATCPLPTPERSVTGRPKRPPARRSEIRSRVRRSKSRSLRRGNSSTHAAIASPRPSAAGAAEGQRGLLDVVGRRADVLRRRPRTGRERGRGEKEGGGGAEQRGAQEARDGHGDRRSNAPGDPEVAVG